MMNVRTTMIIVMLMLCRDAFAHKAPHTEEKEATTVNQPIDEAAFAKINRLYEKGPRAIFVNKCFDCHSTQTRYPWYYAMPGIQQMIDRDVREGRAHLDFTEGFPFKGHGTPQEDLEGIQKAVVEDTMPPFRYRILHRESRLTNHEKQIIRHWIRESQGR